MQPRVWGSAIAKAILHIIILGSQNASRGNILVVLCRPIIDAGDITKVEFDSIRFLMLYHSWILGTMSSFQFLFWLRLCFGWCILMRCFILLNGYFISMEMKYTSIAYCKGARNMRAVSNRNM